jgi:hypothetical protein
MKLDPKNIDIIYHDVNDLFDFEILQSFITGMIISKGEKKAAYIAAIEELVEQWCYGVFCDSTGTGDTLRIDSYLPLIYQKYGIEDVME